MVGQESLQKELFSHSLQYSRKTMLFLGEYGCGKHTLAKELANHFCLDLHDITDEISQELLEEIRFRSIPAFYLIYINALTEKQQNIILKFIEEPGDNAYIILICDNKYGVLETVMNRCAVYEFAPYSKEELSSILGLDVNPEILKVCSTPGQVKLVQNNYTSLLQLCDTIVTKLSKANISNTLTISSKINYKDEYDKFDFTVFLKVLMEELFNSYLKDNNLTSLKLYELVQNQTRRLGEGKLNKETFMNHLLTEMWLVAKENA